MAGRVGDLQPITESVSEITTALKGNGDSLFYLVNVQGDIESQAGALFETFVPVSFASQTVAGTNYFVKVCVCCSFG
jgi:hypothetical protein